MGLRINTNVSSIRAQNSLSKTTKNLNQSLTRLSTGLRINSAKDDGVGLAKSQALDSQVRGSEVAKSNISNALSVTGVAEGYLEQLTDISNQLRDLAVQAADGTLSSDDRSTLTSTRNDLISEYRRLSTDANFNGVKLLDGTFTSKNIQVGANNGDAISLSISDARADTVGKIATYTTQSRSNTVTTSTGAAFGDPSGISINGTAIATTAFSDDGVSNLENAESAISYVNAINEYSATTGVTATVLANTLTFDYSSGNALDSDWTLSLNGVSIKDSSNTNVYASDDAGVANIVSLINAKSSETGVVATQDANSDDLILTAEDGRNIDVSVGGTLVTSDTTNVFGMTGSATNLSAAFRSTFQLTSSDQFILAGADAEFASAASITNSLSDSTSLNNISFTTSANASTAIAILDQVIEQLSTKRADIGAKANRFEIADAQLSSQIENTSAAVSSIRDADIASETAKYTQSNILQQAGATVLAQANSSPQIALQLLNNL